MKKLLLLFLLFILFSCSEKKVSNIKAIFNIPILIGKNIDEVRKELGRPEDNELEPSDLQIKLGVETWENSFEKEGHSLLVTFNPKTRVVIDFFIGTNEPSGSTSNYDSLIAFCNAKVGDEEYIIEPVPTIKDRSRFVGIMIIKK